LFVCVVISKERLETGKDLEKKEQVEMPKTAGSEIKHSKLTKKEKWDY